MANKISTQPIIRNQPQELQQLVYLVNTPVSRQMNKLLPDLLSAAHTTPAADNQW